PWNRPRGTRFRSKQPYRAADRRCRQRETNARHIRIAFLVSAACVDYNSCMNRILVLYDSRSGNVSKMANLVAEGARSISETEVRLCSVDDATAEDVRWCDGIAVGSPTNMGILSWKMKRFWDETMREHWMEVDGKIGCAFSSA